MGNRIALERPVVSIMSRDLGIAGSLTEQDFGILSGKCFISVEHHKRRQLVPAAKLGHDVVDHRQGGLGFAFENWMTKEVPDPCRNSLTSGVAVSNDREQYGTVLAEGT
jgi:hypothetical protein